MSVCVPVRNGQRYLRACLDSILAQSFTDFELIICDNASTDATESICLAYAQRDPRIRYVRQPKNVGPAGNFNTGLELAKGEYFHWQAHDDLISPDYLARCVEVLDADPSAVLVYPRAMIIDDYADPIGPYDFVVDASTPDVRARFRRLLQVRHRQHRNFEVFGLMRTAAARQVPGGHRPFAHGDRIFMVRLALYGRLVQIEPRLFLARAHANQSMQTLPRRALPGGAGYSVLTRWLGPGPLPPPEWWNPALADRICFPDWNLMAEYRQAVAQTPHLSATERIGCYAALAEWVLRFWPKLARDVAFALETIVRRAIRAIRSAVSPATAAPPAQPRDLHPGGVRSG
ncbi:MAG TPA: glycosyltransferase family A protein [Tepidisphaeraceae bacterium]